MAEVKWIKITTDIFSNKKMKHLRRQDFGNEYMLIWILLLTIAGRCNEDGKIFLTENLPYTSKMLAKEFGFKPRRVQAALELLEDLECIYYSDGFIYISDWESHQNVDGLERIRQQNRERAARFREKQKRLRSSVTDNVTDNAEITPNNGADIDIEKEIDIDKDIIILPTPASAGADNTTKTKKGKIPPTLEEVIAYCRERENGIDAAHFFDYYEAKDWRMGKNKMTDWKAAVRNWERGSREKRNYHTTPLGKSFETEDFFAAAVGCSYDSFNEK